jgi:hypothetical protein
MLGSLRLDGSNASMTLDGATDNLAFSAYVCHVLAPTLKPGDHQVIFDNLPAHHSAAAQATIRAVGAEILPLPPTARI